MTAAHHWGRPYVGRGYRACAGCWGFVRLAFAEQQGVHMPEVAIGTEEAQVGAIRAAVQGSGWRLVDGPPQEWDVLLMRDPEGQRHVGIACKPQHHIGLLHCTEREGVNWIELRRLPELGYRDIEIWRRAA